MFGTLCINLPLCLQELIPQSLPLKITYLGGQLGAQAPELGSSPGGGSVVLRSLVSGNLGALQQLVEMRGASCPAGAAKSESRGS